jgi:hypothetical protein
MAEIEFTTNPPTCALGVYDKAYVDDGQDPAEALVQAAYESLSTDLEITVAGVTLFAAAWLDPDHWAEEWAEALSCDRGDAPGEAAALIASALR